MGRLRAVLAIAIVASGSVALAGPTDAQKTQASELVKKAIARSQAGDHAEAIDLYRQAYSLIPLPVLLSNIGSEYAQSGKPVEALESFCRYLDADPTGANASYAKAQAKTLAVQLGRTADEDPCKPPAAPPPPPETGTTTTTGTDTDHGASTSAGTGATTGTTQLTATAAAPSHKSQLPTIGLAVGGVGIAALGAGIAFGIDGKNESDFITNYTKNYPGKAWPSDIQQRQQRGDRDNTLQAAFMIGGGVALATGAILFVVGRSHHGAERVAIVPTATPTSAGLVAAGRF